MPLRLRVRKLWGSWTLSALVGTSQFLKAEERLDDTEAHTCTVFIKHGIHKGASQLRDRGGLGIFLPTSSFLIYPALGNLLCS